MIVDVLPSSIMKLSIPSKINNHVLINHQLGSRFWMTHVFHPLFSKVMKKLALACFLVGSHCFALLATAQTEDLAVSTPTHQTDFDKMLPDSIPRLLYGLLGLLSLGLLLFARSSFLSNKQS